MELLGSFYNFIKSMFELRGMDKRGGEGKKNSLFRYKKIGGKRRGGKNFLHFFLKKNLVIYLNKEEIGDENEKI